MPRFVRFAIQVMQVTPGATDAETALQGISAMEDFYHSIGMPINLKELGIQPTDEQIAELAEGCMAACGSKTGSAKALSLSDMIAIYQNAR